MATDSGLWEPRSPEDHLLHNYWRRAEGTLFVEVPIGGPGQGQPPWPSGCTARRLDGVRFFGGGVPNGAFRIGMNQDKFDQLLSTAEVELIEVKVWLDRYIIGQAVAARHMFPRHYAVRPARIVVLCEGSDSALEWVCKQEGIVVETESLGGESSAPR